MACQGMFLQTDFANANLFIEDRNLAGSEDYELWLRFCLIHKCRLHLIPKILAKYRVHEAQLTQSKIGESIHKANDIRGMILEKIEANEQKKYKMALKEIKKKKPTLVKIRHSIRDSMIRIFPKTVTDNILKIYL